MTRRPADISPEQWAGLLYGKFERLERAWVRLYCVVMPRPYRRRLFWLAGLGPIGMVVAIAGGRVLAIRGDS